MAGGKLTCHLQLLLQFSQDFAKLVYFFHCVVAVEGDAQVGATESIQMFNCGNMTLRQGDDEGVGFFLRLLQAEGGDGAAGILGGDDLVAHAGEHGAGVMGEAGGVLVYVGDAEFLQQGYAFVHGDDAGDVVGAAVEAEGAIGGGEVIVEPVEIILGGVGTDDPGLHLFGNGLADVEEAGSGQGEKRFLAAGGEDVYVHGLHIDGHVADGLNGVYGEEDVVLVAELADLHQIGAMAGEELDGADGDEAGVFGDIRPYRFQSSAAILGRNLLHGDAIAGQAHPGVGVGGELQIAKQNLVTWLPADGLGDHV